MVCAHYEFSATTTIKPKVTPHVYAATSTEIKVKPLVSVADILGQIKERAELQRRAQALTSTGCGKKNKNRNRKKKRAGIGC
ncbi:hypothetical protein GGI05_005891 [Coemansia sp. RSA 2603]|nr:hypothetical protein GGI05_005891 [Coemansia sp. RSA 2603]